MTRSTDAPGHDAAAPSRSTRLDHESIEIVRASVKELRGQEDVLAELFYEQLFAMVPEVRVLFPPDMGAQHVRLLEALLSTIDGLDDPEAMERRLVTLGADHFRRGVAEEQFLYVPHALVRAVRELQQGDWSSSLSSAWIGLYSWMIDHLATGCRAARATAARAAAARSVGN
jgi:hemoglobin-like flavoprotein